MAGSEPEAPLRRGMLFAIPATPGVWLGFIGLGLVVVAAALPWYTISAQVPPVYAKPTTIIQFDGLNGLYVHQDLKSFMHWDPPAVGFPFVLLYALSTFLKVRKLLRSTTHKMRAATLFRSSLIVLIPFVITIIVISQIPGFVPASAPQQAKDLAHEIGARPLGGAQSFNFTVTPDPLFPPVVVVGALQWGFGPALWVMIAAAALMNLGSRLEMHAYRKAHRDMSHEQGEG